MTRPQTSQLKARFLQAFRIYGNVTRAAAEAGTDRTMAYDWKKRDPEFAAAFAIAELEAIEVLENEAYRRGVEGVARKRFSRSGRPLIDPDTGNQYVEREYSDTLLMCLLKARAPDKYRERQSVEHTGSDGQPLEIVIRREVGGAAAPG